MISGGKVSGHFTLLKYNVDTNELIEQRDFDNLITNFGLQTYCETSLFHMPKACVGTGLTEPSVTDTTLENFLAKSNTNLWQYKGSLNTPQAPDWISTVTGTARFNAGTFDGTNLTEVGVCPNSASDNRVWCRARILDEQGRPSSITVLLNEYLDVRYTLRYHPNLTDGNFSFDMDGVTYQCITRAAKVNENVFNVSGSGTVLYRPVIGIQNVYNSQSSLGEITSEPVFSSGGRLQLRGQLNATNLAWSSENPYSIFTRQTLPLNLGNFSDGNGIGALLVGPTTTLTPSSSGIMSLTQIAISPPLPKNANSEMTFVFGQTISRWTPPTP